MVRTCLENVGGQLGFARKCTEIERAALENNSAALIAVRCLQGNARPKLTTANRSPPKQPKNPK